MTTTEKIVEAYFRLCKRCLTVPDVKVGKGNNRQFDLLAYSPTSGTAYHVETSITHKLSWCPDPQKLRRKFERKFFGAPAKNRGLPPEECKDYYSQIANTYALWGLKPEDVVRVWVCWTCKRKECLDECLSSLAEAKGLPLSHLLVLSLRDDVIPALWEEVSTSHYDDDILRMLSLLRQRERQTRGQSIARTLNAALLVNHIPLPDASWDEIEKFALTFNGDKVMGPKACAKLANSRTAGTLSELRACLWFEQRRWKHFGCEPDEESMAQVRHLVQQISAKVVEGDRN